MLRAEVPSQAEARAQAVCGLGQQQAGGRDGQAVGRGAVGEGWASKLGGRGTARGRRLGAATRGAQSGARRGRGGRQGAHAEHGLGALARRRLALGRRGS